MCVCVCVPGVGGRGSRAVPPSPGVPPRPKLLTPLSLVGQLLHIQSWCRCLDVFPHRQCGGCKHVLCLTLPPLLLRLPLLCDTAVRSSRRQQPADILRARPSYGLVQVQYSRPPLSATTVGRCPTGPPVLWLSIDGVYPTVPIRDDGQQMSYETARPMA